MFRSDSLGLAAPHDCHLRPQDARCRQLRAGPTARPPIGGPGRIRDISCLQLDVWARSVRRNTTESATREADDSCGEQVSDSGTVWEELGSVRAPLPIGTWRSRNEWSAKEVGQPGRTDAAGRCQAPRSVGALRPLTHTADHRQTGAPQEDTTAARTTAVPARTLPRSSDRSRVWRDWSAASISDQRARTHACQPRKLPASSCWA